jgi:hypothetical protein
MLATGSVVTSATMVRAALGSVELLAQRTPPLMRLAVAASRGSDKAQAEFRDDLLALAHDSAELSWRELRRGVDAFDAFTRPKQDAGDRPHRPYRVKL